MSLLADVRTELERQPGTAADVAARLGADAGLVQLAIGHWSATGVIRSLENLGTGCSTVCPPGTSGVLRSSCRGCPLAQQP